MEKQKAISKLERQLRDVESMRQKTLKSLEFQKWHRDTKVALENIFGKKNEHVYEFSWISYRRISRVHNLSQARHHQAYLEGLGKAEVLLKSFVDEITDYWPEEGLQVEEEEVAGPAQTGMDVFVIDGGDEPAGQEVAEVVEQLGLKAVVMPEQTKGEHNIIEKFEDGAGEYAHIGFAVVLLEPDDENAAGDEEERHMGHASQNVIFEFGFIEGRLGSKRICALVKGDIEEPSETGALLHIPMDEAGEWKLKLAQGIQAAGIDVNLGKLS